MQEEIFGPLLPILPYATLDEAVERVNQGPKPLSLYVFSRSRAATERVLAHTSAGGTCVNETLLHFINPSLPFGGIGNSGFGRGHGRADFVAFSNERGVLEPRVRLGLVEMLLPPYGGRLAQRLLAFILKFL
jgi:aldehyde dehydrogenase (NAD+)